MGKELACDAGYTGDMGLIPGLGRSPGGGKWQPTPVFLPENSCGQRSLASPKGHNWVGHNWATMHAVYKFIRIVKEPNNVKYFLKWRSYDPYHGVIESVLQKGIQKVVLKCK